MKAPNQRLEQEVRLARWRSHAFASQPSRYATGVMLRALKDRRSLRRAWRGWRRSLGTESDHRVHGRSAIVAYSLTNASSTGDSIMGDEDLNAKLKAAAEKVVGDKAVTSKYGIDCFGLV